MHNHTKDRAFQAAEIVRLRERIEELQATISELTAALKIATKYVTGVSRKYMGKTALDATLALKKMNAAHKGEE